MKIFCANINWEADESELDALFESVGPVRSAKITCTPDGHPRGFGFVEMVNAEDIERAIAQLNNYMWHGRRLQVDKATPRAEGRR